VKRMVSRVSDESGAGMSTVTFFFIAVLLLLFGMTVDLGKIYIVKVKTLYALEDGLMAAANQVDKDKLVRGKIWIDPIKARQTFQDVFSSSAKLDRRGNPLPGNKTYGGRVRIEEFRVYNRYPRYGPHGLYIDRPTVYAKLTFPVDLMVFRFVQPTAQVPVWTSVGANRQGE
jgi:hypothetical protein